MDDLISRQAAIDTVKGEFFGALTPEERACAIRDLPSTQPEDKCGECDAWNQYKNYPRQQWIPCSEETGDGYPEEDGFYYVTEQNYSFYLDADCKQRVTHTSRFKNGDFIDRFYTENSSNITAWMPLPKQYKGEES